MTLPNLFRRLLSRLRSGKSPQVPAVRPERDYARGVAQVPEPLPACDLTRFEKTSRIDPAVQRAVPVAPDDKFGPAPASPRTRGGTQVYGPTDDIHGPTNRGRFQ